MNGLDGLSEADLDWNKVNLETLGINIARGFVGAVAKDHELGKITKLGLDTWQAVENVKNIRKHFKNWRQIKFIYDMALEGKKFSSAAGWGSFLSNITKPLQYTSKWSGKIAPWLAVADIGLSLYEFGQNWAHENWGGVLSNAGDILMSGAIVASATGAGAPVAAGMAVIGGALWVTGKVVEHWGTVKKVFTQPVETAKKVGNELATAAKNVANTVKEGVSNAIDTVKGWFS